MSARYKIYIIDEVHMLSKAAFNGLLKTLEEPPGHVKFLFATTEVQKVPVTVLSRCQRFDLRRIPAELLADHFARVAEAEGMAAEQEALALIARAAEGSARDGLSMLDQAIAHADLEGGGVRAETVRAMLGLSDRGAIRALFGHLLAGEAVPALAALRQQYDLGVDPQAVLRTLLETVHGVTLAKLGNEPQAAQPLEEREAYGEWAAGLSFPLLHRLWQMLLRGHDEVANAALPIEACEMALLRVIHAATLPDPGDLARRLLDGRAPDTAQSAPPPAQPAAPSPPAAPAPVARQRPAVPETAEIALPETVAELAELLAGQGRHLLGEHVRNHLRPIRFAPPEIVLSIAKPLPTDFVRDLSAELFSITRRRWHITTDTGPGAPSVSEEHKAAETQWQETVLAAPSVTAARAAFPDAQVDWNRTRSSK